MNQILLKTFDQNFFLIPYSKFLSAHFAGHSNNGEQLENDVWRFVANCTVQFQFKQVRDKVKARRLPINLDSPIAPLFLRTKTPSGELLSPIRILNSIGSTGYLIWFHVYPTDQYTEIALLRYFSDVDNNTDCKVKYSLVHRSLIDQHLK